MGAEREVKFKPIGIEIIVDYVPHETSFGSQHATESIGEHLRNRQMIRWHYHRNGVTVLLDKFACERARGDRLSDGTGIQNYPAPFLWIAHIVEKLCKLALQVDVHEILPVSRIGDPLLGLDPTNRDQSSIGHRTARMTRLARLS